MADDYRHAGTHWPGNAGGEHPNREAITDLPGSRSAILICSPSARYHYAFVRQRCPDALAVWRAIPRQGRLPAQLGWDAEKVATECLNLWDEQPHGGTEWFLPLNELQFEKEAGEPFRGYRYVAGKLAALRVELEDRFAALGQTVCLVFPAWVPQDDLDRADEWVDEAKRWGALCLHAYGSADEIEARYRATRALVGDLPILLGEWNANHTGADERATLEMLARLAAEDAGLLGATYYIYETRNDGEADLSIWGNPERLALFRDPPTAATPAAPPEPAPEEPPMPEAKSREEVIAISNAIADEYGIPRRLLLACGVAESNLVWNARRPADPSQDATFWPDLSGGAWQQTVRYDPEYQGGDAYPGPEEVERVLTLQYDVERAARVAAEQLKRHLQAAMAA